MSEILNIEELRKLANPTIEIPGFSPGETIKVRVQQPKLLKMAKNGDIPNALLNIAAAMVSGEKIQIKKDTTDEEKIKIMNDTMDLYCMACLVEPKYEEFKDIMTDDQKGTIFQWAIGQVSDLNSFRNEKPNANSNKSSK